MRRISPVVSLLAGSIFAAWPSLAQNPHPVDHPNPPAHPAVHRAVPPGTYRVIRPGAGFQRAPAAAFRAHPLHAIVAAHVPFARFTPAQRAVWVRGNWHHRWWNGRYGWWWYAGGVWFWYGAPVYPYPTMVSDYYYEEPATEAVPGWWYCYNPPGYYPYVPSCSQPWTPVPAQGGPSYDEEQGGPEQGPPPDDQYNEQGPPPGDQYNEQGPPPGGQYNEQGPPPGYEQPPAGNDQGPPPGYDQGPPPGDQYGPDQGPPPGDQGPPPGSSPYPQNSH